MIKKGILLISHGSSRPDASKALMHVRDDIAKRFAGIDVQLGFMEFESPSIPEAIADMVKNGVKSIRIIPYFLQEGKHLRKDIPALIDSSQKKYSDVDIKMADYIGYDPIMTEILISRLKICDPEFLNR